MHTVENKADIAILRRLIGNILIVQHNLTALWLFQSRDTAQQRRLSAPAGT